LRLLLLNRVWLLLNRLWMLLLNGLRLSLCRRWLLHDRLSLLRWLLYDGLLLWLLSHWLRLPLLSDWLLSRQLSNGLLLLLLRLLLLLGLSRWPRALHLLRSRLVRAIDEDRISEQRRSQ
jgi:hypothetical protein